MSNGLLNPKHYLNQLLINISASISLSSITLAKSVFLEKILEVNSYYFH